MPQRQNRGAIVIGLTLLTWVVNSGCQMWQVEPSVWLDDSSAKTAESVRVALNVDGWRSNRHWTPQEEWRQRRGSLPTPAAMRWSFTSAKPEDQVPKPSPSPKLETTPQKPSAAASGAVTSADRLPHGRVFQKSVLTDSQIIRAQSPAEPPVSNPATKTSDLAGSTNAQRPADTSSPRQGESPAEPSSESGETKKESSPKSQETSSDSQPEAQQSSLNPTNDPAEGSPAAWDGFWPLGIDQLIETTALETSESEPHGTTTQQATFLRSLSTLARSDTLAGWNATIIWARHNPADAVAAAAVLERLVADPPYYNPSTGKRVFPNASSGENTSLETSQTSDSLSNDALVSTAVNAAKAWQKLTGVEEAEKKNVVDSPSRQISESMRLAAAEAWCLLLAHEESDPTEGLAPVGLMLERVDLPVKVRGELFRGAARWVEPANIPRLENALREGDDHERADVGIRRAAIESCLIHALWSNENRIAPAAPEGIASSTESAVAGKLEFHPESWPATCSFCRNDPDPAIRWTYGAWMAVSHSPQALDVLKSQLYDVDLRVRDEATSSLALLGTNEAREELRSYAERSRDRIRATAVHGLSSWGLKEITPFVRDESYIVRNAVAVELGRHPCVESAVLLQELLVDSSSEVQHAALKALDDWSETLAIPLLLHGMRDSSAKTRQECFRALTARRKIDMLYQFDASRDDRARAVQEIVQKENLPETYVERIAQTGFRTAAKVDDLHVQEIQSLLKQLEASQPQSPERVSALERLKNLSTGDANLVEGLLPGMNPETSTIIQHDILPQLNPAYSALLELQDSDLLIRRRGATTLSRLGQTSSLSPPVLRRLREVLVNEQDRWVWRAALTAVSADATDESAEIALLAVNNPWPDIRELGCEYVARHGQPRMALWLLPLLEDSSKTVQLAAVKALGRCHNPIVLDGLSEPSADGSKQGLREFLGNPDKSLQFAAMVSMSQLGDPQGIQELMRMSYHQSAQIREEAVRQMGETGQNRFVGHLINLAWTESHETVRRSILDSLERLVPVDKRPQGLEQATGQDAKIRLWASWWQA